MAEELKIIIDADVSQAQAGLTQFADTVENKVVKPLKEIAPAANAGLNATTQQAKIVTLAVSKLGSTIDALKQKVAGKQALISTERDVNNIAVLNKEIQALEAEILRVQNIGKVGFNEFGRAVSDSSDKIVAGFGNAFGAIRRLAFILPGIGIAGIFDAAFTGFQKLVTALQSANFGVPKFKDLISSVEGAKDEFVKASVTVETLKDEIQLAKEGFIAKDEVVKKYNETIGKTTGFVKTLDQAEAALNKNANAYIQFTLLKAAANIALSKSAEVAFQAALQNQKDLERISKITADKEGIGEFIKSGEENLRKAEQETFAKRVQSLKDIASNFLKEAGEIKKQFNFNFFDDNKQEKTVKGLTEVQRKLIELAEQAQKTFNVPLKLRFDSSDLDIDKFNKAKAILKGIEDHTIRLIVIPPDKIELPKLQPEIDKPFFKKEFDDLVKGFTVPLQILLDKPSLLQAEDQLKQIFSGFSDTNIFTEFGKQAGQKFREALTQAIAVFDKGFVITPEINVNDIISSLTSSLAGIKDIQLQVIKTEDFNSAIRTLRDLHDAGVAAGKAVEQAFKDAGGSSEDAAKIGTAITKSFQGISQQAEDIARSLDGALTPAFTDLFDAILAGKDPVKAFFQGLLHSIEEVASKLVASQIEKAILSIVATSTTAQAAIAATTVATTAASAAGAAAAGVAAAAAAGAATAAAAASAAAAAAVIAAAAAKAATASVGFANPLALLGLIGGFFAEGGEPPVGKISVVGEKGPELFIPKVPGTILSHKDSVKLLSNSVKTDSVRDHERIKEYFISEKINQALKEHTARISESIKTAIAPVQVRLNDTVKIIATNNEKLTAYSYKLHEVNTNNIQSIKESFVSSSDHFAEFSKLVNSFKVVEKTSSDKDRFVKTDNYFESFSELVKSFKGLHSPDRSIVKEKENLFELSTILKTFSSSVSGSSFINSDKFISSIQDKVTNFKDQFRNNIESSVSNNILSNILQRYENSRQESVKENGFSSSSILNKSFSRITDSFTENKIINSFEKLKELLDSEKLVNNFYENYTKQGFKESFISEKENSVTFEKAISNNSEKTNFERITSDIKNIISKIQVDRFTDKLSESYKSLSETINNSFSKLDKVTERINTVKSFNVEKIVNNNFISKDSFKETFKTFSLERLQREFHIPAFAQGGAVFGPTLAILGEGFGISRSNPEFVGTASQLKGIQGGAFDVNVNVNGDISFDMGKLAIALNKEERSHMRTNGKKPF